MWLYTDTHRSPCRDRQFTYLTRSAPDVYFGTALWQTQSQAPVEEKQRQMCEHDDTHVCTVSYGRPHTFVHMSECETGTRRLLKMRVLFECKLGFALAHIHLLISQQLEDAWLSHLLPGLIISDQKELQHRRRFIFSPPKTAAFCCGFTPWHSKHLGFKSHLTFCWCTEHLTMHNCVSGEQSLKGQCVKGVSVVVLL